MTENELIEKQSLELPDDITDRQIAEYHGALDRAIDGAYWQLGDLYKHVAKVRPTKRADDDAQMDLDIEIAENERVRMLMQHSLHDSALHRKIARVAEALEPKDRKPSLPWQIHFVCLEECGVFSNGGVQKKDGGGVEKAKGWIEWAGAEWAGGHEMSQAEMRKLIRSHKPKDATDKKTQDKSGNESQIGEMLRDLQQMTMKVRKVSASQIPKDQREEIGRKLKPIVDFYRSLFDD